MSPNSRDHAVNSARGSRLIKGMLPIKKWGLGPGGYSRALAERRGSAKDATEHCNEVGSKKSEGRSRKYEVRRKRLRHRVVSAGITSNFLLPTSYFLLPSYFPPASRAPCSSGRSSLRGT